MSAPDPLDHKFWSRVIRRSANECWQWIGAINEWGYGHYSDTSRSRSPLRAHRVAYEALVGPIPDGLTIDHLCRNPACVNPEHMEPVTVRENILRGESPIAKQARQTHCIHGHEFTFENTHVRDDGSRQCRKCVARRCREKRLRRKQREGKM